ncbi:hypothetical protein [Streptosporangium sp. NPDC004631]
MTSARYLSRRNLVGLAMGAVIALSVGLAVVYAGMVFALVLAGAVGLLIGLAIGMEVVDSRTGYDLARARMDLATERARVTVLEATNVELRAARDRAKQNERLSAETAGRHLDRLKAAEARIAGEVTT